MITQGGIASLIQAALALVIGGFTLQAAGAFRRIVDTRGDDIFHLMNALGALRTLYLIQVILFCIGLGLAVLGALLMRGGR